ncbi:MAG: LacI family DNA-binding transcriptional regulator [Acinetobacter sp.]
MSDQRDKSSTKKSITAHDVAQLAGVSQSAVSRHFTPGASVSAKTREKIAKAAEQLGYRPNLIARSLITKKSNLIGIVLPLNTNPYYQSILEHLSHALATHGYRILLFTNPAGHDSDELIEEILHYPLDGLILVAVNLASHLADECQQNGLPVVMMTRKTESNLISSITGDNLHAAETIAAFLVAGQHQHFAFMAGEPQSSTSRDREQAFFNFLSKSGIHDIQKVIGHYQHESACIAARALFSSATVPDAIFCANDQMALATLDIARSEFGLVAGKDVSIIGFDDNYLASWGAFELTTYSQPVTAMVAQAIELLLAQIEKTLQAPQHLTVSGELIIRSSARRPKHGIIQKKHYLIWES